MKYGFVSSLQTWTADVWMVAALAISLAFVTFVFYCRTLQQTLRAAAPANQRMPPWQAWLLVVPVFNIFFSFLTAARVADTICAEAESRGIDACARPTYAVGVALAVTSALCYLPQVGAVAGLACVVFWILHWVQVAEWNSKLRSENGVSASERVLFDNRSQQA